MKHQPSTAPKAAFRVPRVVRKSYVPSAPFAAQSSYGMNRILGRLITGSLTGRFRHGPVDGSSHYLRWVDQVKELHEPVKPGRPI